MQPEHSLPDSPEAQNAIEPPRLGGPGVFGVLSIIFGSLQLMLSLSTGCAMGCTEDLTKLDIAGKQSAEHKVRLRQAHERYNEAALLPTVLSTTLYLSLSALLIAIGVGQLRRKRWAWRATRWWSLAALLTLISTTVLWLTLVGPAQRAQTATQLAIASPAEVKGMKLAAEIGEVLGWVLIGLQVPYPVLMAIYFGRTRVRDAMIS